MKERVKPDELPNDYYTQVSTGVGTTAVFVEQNLTNIQNVLLNINLLDGSFAMLAKRIGKIAIGISSARRLGYVGLTLGAASGTWYHHIQRHDL